MTNSKPTLPLVRAEVDVRERHSLLEGRVSAAIFGGWGVRVLSNGIW